MRRTSLLFIVVFVAFLAASFPAGAQVITTVAGGGPNGVPALSANLAPSAVVRDQAGNLFIAAAFQNRVFKVDSEGQLTVVAGSGTFGFSGDGGPATAAGLAFPEGVAVDAAGDLFIADSFNARIRRVDATSGIITTVAGNGFRGFNGDGGPATSANLTTPTGIAVDSSGNLFIADTENARIRRVDGATDIITSVAGNGTAGFSGDGGPATSAELSGPSGIAVDSSGNLFIADAGNERIRRVDATTGIITTVAGNGSAGFSGDGGPATGAGLFGPAGIAVDSSGNLFITDSLNNRIRRVNAATRIITTVAGNGMFGFSGDGGPATSAELLVPTGVSVDSSGNLFIADTENARIRRVDATTGIITTVAGNGSFGFSGDGGPATSADLNFPTGIAIDSSGNLFITDSLNNRIRRVNAATRIITTVAGNGTAGFSGDGGPAASAELDLSVPLGCPCVALDSSGNLFIADAGNERIRRVDATTGIITTVAGNGIFGFSGDGGPATSGEFFLPTGVAVDSFGNLFIADTVNERIRRVGPGPAVSLAPTSLTFPAQAVGSTSAPQTVTLTNTGTALLQINSRTIVGANASDFAFAPGTTCPIGAGNVAVGASCTTSVTFTPTATGTRSAAVNISDNVTGSPQVVPLMGGVVGADLAVTKTASPNPVPLGASLSYAITVANHGPSAATGVTVTDTLPPNVTFGSATATQGNCAQTSGTVTCTLRNLANARSEEHTSELQS